MELFQANTIKFEKEFASIIKSHCSQDASGVSNVLLEKKLFPTKLYHHIVAKDNILLNYEKLLDEHSEVFLSRNQSYSDEEYTGNIDSIVAKTLEVYQNAGDPRCKTAEGLAQVLEDIFSICLLMKELLKHKPGDLFNPDSLKSEHETYKALSLPLVSLCLGVLDMQKDLVFEYSLGLRMLSFLLNSKDHALEFVDGDGIEKLLRPLIGVSVAGEKEMLPFPLQVQVLDAIEKIITYPEALRKIANKKSHFRPFQLPIGKEFFRKKEKKAEEPKKNKQEGEEKKVMEVEEAANSEKTPIEKASVSKEEEKHVRDHKSKRHHSSKRSRSRSKSKGK